MDERCVFCGTEEERHYDGVQCPIGDGKFSATQKFTPPTKRTAELERELAEVCARGDIGSFCRGHIQSGKQWFEARVPRYGKKAFEEQMQADIDRAIEYLELRGLIERHPRQKWVHVKEAA